jgi:hypothetical protein
MAHGGPDGRPKNSESRMLPAFGLLQLRAVLAPGAGPYFNSP